MRYSGRSTRYSLLSSMTCSARDEQRHTEWPTHPTVRSISGGGCRAG